MTRPMRLIVNGRPRVLEDPVYDEVLARTPHGEPAAFQSGVVITLDGRPHLVETHEWRPATLELLIETAPLFPPP